MDTMTLAANGTLILRRPHLFGRSTHKPLSFHAAVMASLWLFIGLVGALDTYLTVKYRKMMPQVEENPVGCLLMRLDGGDVSLFVGVKVAGIILVLGVLAALVRWARLTFAYAVLVPIAVAQLALVGYLFS